MIKVILIEDEYDFAYYVKGRLFSEGINIDVRSSEDVVKSIKEGSLGDPDVIITDVSMPMYTGFEVIEKLKENQATANIPIIVMTFEGGEGSFEDRVEAIVHKPYKHDEFVNAIKGIYECKKKTKVS